MIKKVFTEQKRRRSKLIVCAFWITVFLALVIGAGISASLGYLVYLIFTG